MNNITRLLSSCEIILLNHDIQHDICNNYICYIYIFYILLIYFLQSLLFLYIYKSLNYHDIT